MIFLVGLAFCLAVLLTVNGVLADIKSFLRNFICRCRTSRSRKSVQKPKSVTSHDAAGAFRPYNVHLPYIDEWFQTKMGIYYYSLGNYVPNRYKPEQYPFLQKHMTEIAYMRKWVWDFKYNLQEPNPVEHARAVEEAARRISFIINNLFPEFTSNITFICLPASNNLVYHLRFREFAALVCKATGMTDAFDYVYVVGEKTPKHIGGGRGCSFVIDYEWLVGRNIILFDDVVSSGHTIDVYAKNIGEWGISVLCALTLARTVSQDEMEQGIYRQFSLETKLRSIGRTSKDIPRTLDNDTGQKKSKFVANNPFL